MRQPTQQQLENQVTQFNDAYKVGDKVEVLKYIDEDAIFIDEVAHKATIMGGHTAMTWLKDKGSYDLTFVRGLASKH